MGKHSGESGADDEVEDRSNVAVVAAGDAVQDQSLRAGHDGSGRGDGVADAKVMEHLPQGCLQGGATLPEGFAQGGIVAGLHEEDEPRAGQGPLIHGGAVQ